MRKLAYHVATTIDGFIARADGSVDGFLMEGEHAQDFVASLADYDTVLMGRGTYEFGRKLGVTSPYPMLRQFVFSRSMKGSPDPAVTLVSGDAPAVVSELKAQTGKDIWLCGGADLASSLFAAGLVDALIVKINPVVFGAGKSLFAGPIAQAALSLATHKIYGNGVVVLRYEIKPRT